MRKKYEEGKHLLVDMRWTTNGVPLIAAPSDEDLDFVDSIEPLHIYGAVN